MRRPELGDLDAFAAVATARSFRNAARSRGVSASTLSDSVRRLEERLGARLLPRTTRSVTATEAGLRLLERLGPALAEIAAAVAHVGGGGGVDGPTGTLRLNVPSVVAQLILPRLISRFLLEHPGITAEVTADDRFIDVLAAGFDAGVRYDERLERDMIAVPIGPRIQRTVTAAAPSYWNAHGRPRTPHDLLEHRCIRHRFASGAIAAWEVAKHGVPVRLQVSGPMIGTLMAIELGAARQGVGVIHTFDGFLANSLADGSLEAVLEDWSESFSGPFLYFAGRRHVPPPLRAFVDFLKCVG